MIKAISSQAERTEWSRMLKFVHCFQCQKMLVKLERKRWPLHLSKQLLSAKCIPSSFIFPSLDIKFLCWWIFWQTPGLTRKRICYDELHKWFKGKKEKPTKESLPSKTNFYFKIKAMYNLQLQSNQLPVWTQSDMRNHHF